MRFECVAFVDDKPRLLGWYSAELPKPIQQLHDRKVWAEFIRPNAAGEGAAKPYPPPAGSVACPSCGGRLHRAVEQGAGWQGECTACHMRGPWRETEAAALEAWLSFADPVYTQNSMISINDSKP
jgi:hypothetical protein